MPVVWPNTLDPNFAVAFEAGREALALFLALACILGNPPDGEARTFANATQPLPLRGGPPGAPALNPLASVKTRFDWLFDLTSDQLEDVGWVSLNPGGGVVGKYTCIFIPSAASLEAWDTDARPDLAELASAVQRIIARARGRRERFTLKPKLERLRAPTEGPEGFKTPPHEGPPLPPAGHPPAAPAEDEAEAPPKLVSYTESRVAVSTFIHHRVRCRNNRAASDRPGQFIDLGALRAGTRKYNQVLHSLAPPEGWREPEVEGPHDPLFCHAGGRCIALWHLRIGTAANNAANKKTDGDPGEKDAAGNWIRRPGGWWRRYSLNYGRVRLHDIGPKSMARGGGSGRGWCTRPGPGCPPLHHEKYHDEIFKCNKTC